jgi:hypothetical protein
MKKNVIYINKYCCKTLVFVLFVILYSCIASKQAPLSLDTFYYHNLKVSSDKPYLAKNRCIMLDKYKNNILNIKNIIFFEFYLNSKKEYYALFVEGNSQYTYSYNISQDTLTDLGVFCIGDSINEFDKNQIPIIISYIKSKKINELQKIALQKYSNLSYPHLIVITYWDEELKKYKTINIMQFLFF